MIRLRHSWRRWAVAFSLFVVTLAGAAITADRLVPLDLTRLGDASTVVTDRAGRPLRIFLTKGGLLRLPANPQQVSANYLAMLTDIEDKRFWLHPGIDPLAVGRAIAQRITHGHVVSGASTLTMQVVRLLEPRPRTLRSKLIELFRAAQLEAHWSKAEILRAYLTLAPMGHNLEGVRAGSLAWFGKEPKDLSDAEAALLVALPQNPNHNRPDCGFAAAVRARGNVLRRATADGVIAPDSLVSALAAPLPEARHPMPLAAPHLAEELAAAGPADSTIETTLDGDLQRSIERVLGLSLDTLPRPVNLAAVVADWHSGEVLAQIGSASYFDARRTGAIDMTEATRSPGSTLKPFIYGMAFEGLLAHPGTLVRDAATRFDDYAPHNFDNTFNGDVTIRQALQWSLNLPAVMALQKVGPIAFTERFKAAGLPFDLGSSAAEPGLPIALGGVGTTLTSLVTAYAALANGGQMKPLTERLGAAVATGQHLMERSAADAVVDILADMPPPSGSSGRAGRIAYKTGTSYRFRDGWAVGFNGSRVIGVWMGRADGGSCAGCVGASAAVILFRLFDLMPPDPLPQRVLDPVFAGPPPPSLLRLEPAGAPSEAQGPRISSPVDRSNVLVDGAAAGEGSPIKLAASGGQRPYRWLVDGRPVGSAPFSRETLWHPDGEGFSKVVVVDAAGRSDTARIRVTAR